MYIGLVCWINVFWVLCIVYYVVLCFCYHYGE